MKDTAVPTPRQEPFRILVVPTTDWTRHPVPNRLNFIFDRIAQNAEVFVFHFMLSRFFGLPERATACHLVSAPGIPVADPSLYYLLSAPLQFAALKRTVNRENIDIIVASNILPAFLSQCTGVPVVFDYLDHLEESASVYYPDSWLGKLVRLGVGAVVRYVVRNSRGVITVTPAFSRHLAREGVKQVRVIPNGVSSGIFTKYPNDEAKKRLGLSGTVLGYVGSLEHWVDLETVVDALPETGATLLVIGPGLFTDYGEIIKKRAMERGVGDRIIYTGQVAYEDLSWYISAMDIGLNPLKPMKKNLWTIGGKIFNYLACGVPVLSSRMPAVVEELGDALTYYDDRASFIKGVSLLLEAPPDEKALRDLAGKYDWDILAREYEAYLTEVIQGTKGPVTQQ